MSSVIELSEEDYPDDAAIHDLHEGQKKCMWAQNPRRPDRLARYVCLCTHRRWGKTEGLLRYAGDICQMWPRASVAHIMQQKVNAEDIAWPILDELDDIYGWNSHPHNVKLYRTFPNKSRIRLYGADDPRFQRLLRGKHFHLVIIDESQDFHFSDIGYLFKRILLPTVADDMGRIIMAGTPPESDNGYFYDTVLGGHSEWTVVCSERMYENPHTARQLKEQVEDLKLDNPEVEKEPWFQREYMGKCIIDTRNNVIQLRPHLNYLYEWDPQDSDRYVLGIDWGFDDASAYVVGTWNPNRYRWFIYLEAYEKKKMLLHDHVAQIRHFQEKYPGIRLVSDPTGNAKALIEELRQVYGLPIEDARKAEKDTYIEIVNSDASLGRVKVYNVFDPDKPEENGVAKQWSSLVWEWIKGKKRQSREDHVHDAALYARRLAMPQLYREPVKEDRDEGRKMRRLRLMNSNKKRHLR
jgi:hypothetical protein